MKRIYLDHAATTPVHPEVAEAMIPYLHETYGNASSTHAFGRAAKSALNRARDLISDYLGCHPTELTFTSGGTESDNMALFGAAAANTTDRKGILTSEIEHHAVLHTCEQLANFGHSLSCLPVDRMGKISLDDVNRLITAETFLVSVMFANNEVGTVQPIEAIGSMAQERGAVFHVDAVQALGSLPIALKDLPVDLMSFSAHKINGPKGVGALYTGKRVPLAARQYGGLQERKRRAGTENVAGIAGFAKAVEILIRDGEARLRQAAALRERFLGGLAERIGTGRYVLNGHPKDHLLHIINVSFPGVDSETMLMNLDMEGIAAASGSACTSGSLELSHVLQAMKLPEEVMTSAVRFSFGYGTTAEDIDFTIAKIETILDRLRK
ncbi:cysteine desulfurase family protein [Paenibacillus gansuensis]|uniref:cysteine desulfurase n=1 Tax=Paenibacillus gansuensis TaxID=306542 RepID=A0ABW5PE77_9BACL